MPKRTWTGEKSTVIKISGGWITVKPGVTIEVNAKDADELDRLQDWTEATIEKAIERAPMDKEIKSTRRKTK